MIQCAYCNRLTPSDYAPIAVALGLPAGSSLVDVLASIGKLKDTLQALADRVAAQSELLTRRAEPVRIVSERPLDPHGELGGEG